MQILKVDNSINSSRNVQFKAANISEEVMELLGKDAPKINEEIQKATEGFDVDINIERGGVNNMQYERVLCRIPEEPLQFKISDDGRLMKVIKYLLSNKENNSYGKIDKITVNRPSTNCYIDIKTEKYKKGENHLHTVNYPAYVQENIVNVVKELIEKRKKNIIEIARFYKKSCPLPNTKEYSLNNPFIRMLIKGAKKV